MFCIYLVTTLITFQCAVSGIQAGKNYSAVLPAWVPIISFVESRCPFEDVETAFVKHFNCFEDSKGFLREAEDILWCTDFAEKSYTCMETFVNDLKPCVKPEESYFSDFMLSSFNVSYQLLCKDGEKAMNEKLEALVEVEELCDEYMGTMAAITSYKCIVPLKFLHEPHETDFFLTKVEFCSYFQEVNDCVFPSLREQCQEEAFPAFWETIFEAYLQWCRKNAFITNTHE